MSEQSSFVLTGGSPVPRPRITVEQIAEALENVAAIVGIDAMEIAKAYRGHRDGYHLARDLDPDGGLTMVDVETLDTVASLIDEAQLNLELKWAAENNPQPPFPIGERLVLSHIRGGTICGVIDGIYDRRPATYKVLVDGETGSARRLIRFEDAVPEKGNNS